MVDRFDWFTVPREPLARTLVQGKYSVWLLLHRARLQDIRTKLVSKRALRLEGWRL